MNTDFMAVLESEGSLSKISKDDLDSRLLLVEAFRSLPKEAITNLRHLLPQAGCLNQCSFCSQSAAPVIWQLTKDALRNLFAALKTVSLEIARSHVVSGNKTYLAGNVLSSEGVFLPNFKMPEFGLVGYGRTNHRPGVIYPYLDNDIASYPFFLQYIKYLREDLGAKVRLSTVGYSRHNQQLQRMHQQINEDHIDALGGVRVSITPYTLGWNAKGEKSGLTSMDEFMLDLANFLATYHPAIDYLGSGDRAASMEFRFPPLISESEIEEKIILNRHVIHTGPYLLIGTVSTNTLPNFHVARVQADNRHSLNINEWFEEYTMVISEKMSKNSAWETITQDIIQKECNKIEEMLPGCTVRQSKLYLMENDDGPYYTVDPSMTEFGHFAKEFYFRSEKRSMSGYIDSERYFLNSLLKHKRSKGIGRKEIFFSASWNDADEVVRLLEKKVLRMESLNPSVANHLKEYVLPIVSTYRKALEMAGYPARYFFDKGFTIDTGEICNLGGAYRDYKGLTSRRNSSVTSQHERVYGHSGALATEGKIWIIGVSPSTATARSNGIPASYPALFVEEQDLEKRSASEGYTLRRWYIPLKKGDVEIVSASQHKEEYLIPGRSIIVKN